MNFKRLILAALMAVFSCPALAATIAPKNPNYAYVANPTKAWLWEQVNNDDNPAEQAIPTGMYEFFVEGTQGGALFTLQHGKTAGTMKPIDTDAMPGGFAFTSSSTNHNVGCLSEGYVDIAFSSVGADSQDLDIWMTYLGNC